MTFEYEEDIVPAWAKLLVECAEEHGAPNFAWNLAERGLVPEEVRIMAERWREGEFDPPEFAGTLDLFADAVEEQSGTRKAAFR
jgi:hypothetical protein